MSNTTYFKGDKAQYTGHATKLHGGLFYEVVLLEGYQQGQTKLVTKAPEGFTPYLLPDNSIVMVDSTAAKDAAVISYTLKGGRIIAAMRVL